METDTAPGEQQSLTAAPRLPEPPGSPPPPVADAGWRAPADELEWSDDTSGRPARARSDGSPSLAAVPTLPGTGPTPMPPPAALAEPATDADAAFVPPPPPGPGAPVPTRVDLPTLGDEPPEVPPTPDSGAAPPGGAPSTDEAGPESAFAAPAPGTASTSPAPPPTLASPGPDPATPFAAPAADATPVPDLGAPVPHDSPDAAFAPPPLAAAPSTPAPAAPALDAPPVGAPAPSLDAPQPAAPTLAPPTGGGPADPDAPLTPTPDWKRRNKGGGGSRVVKVLVVVLLAAAVIAAGWYGLRAIPQDSGDTSPAAAPAANPGEAESSDGGAEPVEQPTLIGETQDLVDDINDRPELDEPLEALGLDEALEPVPVDQPPAAAPAAIGSFEFTWWDSSGFEIAVTVDVSTGDYRAIAVDGTQVLRADGTYYGRSDGTDWVELSGEQTPAIDVVGADGLMAVESVVPAAVDPYVLRRETLDGGQERFVVDDVALAADAELRSAWLGPWGLVGDPSDVVELIVAVDADGTVTEVVMSSSAIGGEAGYRLEGTSPDPLVVEAPTS